MFRSEVHKLHWGRFAPILPIGIPNENTGVVTGLLVTGIELAKGHMSAKTGTATLKAISSAVSALLAEAPVRPAGKKLELHPCGEFEFTVNAIFIKVPEKVTSTEVAPGVTVETGTPRIRVEFKSVSGIVREDYTVWTSPENKKVWLGLSTVLTSLASAEITDLQGFAALIGRSGTFTVRHEVIPAKDKFPARTIATVRPPKKAK